MSMAYLQLAQDERRLFEIYSAFMTRDQERTYLSAPTREARTAYSESLGLSQRLAALPPEEREAILNAEIMEGMSAEGLLMTWGHPSARTAVGRTAEEWVYSPSDSRHISPNVFVIVYLYEDRVDEWVEYPIPAPEVPDD